MLHPTRTPAAIYGARALCCPAPDATRLTSHKHSHLTSTLLSPHEAAGGFAAMSVTLPFYSSCAAPSVGRGPKLSKLMPGMTWQSRSVSSFWPACSLPRSPPPPLDAPSSSGQTESIARRSRSR